MKTRTIEKYAVALATGALALAFSGGTAHAATASDPLCSGGLGNLVPCVQGVTCGLLPLPVCPSSTPTPTPTPAPTPTLSPSQAPAAAPASGPSPTPAAPPPSTTAIAPPIGSRSPASGSAPPSASGEPTKTAALPLTDTPLDMWSSSWTGGSDHSILFDVPQMPTAPAEPALPLPTAPLPTTGVDPQDVVPVSQPVTSHHRESSRLIPGADDATSMGALVLLGLAAAAGVTLLERGLHRRHS